VTAYANIFCYGTYQATKYTVSSFCRQDSTGYYSTYTVPGLTTIQPIYPPTAYPVVASTTMKIDYMLGKNSTKSSCFAGSETLLLESGRSKPISEINVGDRILAADSMGRTSFSEVRIGVRVRVRVRVRERTRVRVRVRTRVRVRVRIRVRMKQMKLSVKYSREEY
jgi:Hint module